ncbi:MAG: glutamine--tRNA ligase/YqeY domain fusion protein [Clostridia bacterium]|nr:glutamine--tRNA ligase/YqeY domain fusion protein [Clostridia bacterium]
MAENFIEEIIENDFAEGKIEQTITRFPPEPNGYLHIGHAKSLCLNFGVKAKYNGRCNLRYDDTNPTKESEEYVDAIEQDIKWLGFEWDELHFASDYFDTMYSCAVTLIKKGLAYVDDMTAEEINATRGTFTTPGIESKNRNRPIEESLSLFEDMKNGKFQDGTMILRAKIDMASPNLNMRDPVIYRVLRANHQHTGDKWCIYPMYDFAHPIEDASERITHSLCTLEFEDHRPLYNWYVENCDFEKPLPRQIEFAWLNIEGTVLSKRFLKRLVEEGKVMGWDDPRMPTLCGMRRRGIPADAIKDFCHRVGIAKANSTVEAEYLDSCVRENLNQTANRVMAVFDPLKVVLTNYEGKEDLDVEDNPNAEVVTTRKVSFSKEIYIDRSDFALVPPPKYHRLKVDGYVRLKGAYIIHCDEAVTDESGKVVQLNCSVVENSKSGSDTSGVKVKGVIQWVDANNYTKILVRELSNMLIEDDGETDLLDRFNPDSLKEISVCAEKALENAQVGDKFQFMRMGYYCKDKDVQNGVDVYNSVVGLKASFKPQK